MAMPVQVSRCMLGMGALSYFFERWVSFFSKMANTPPGVLPLLPLLIVDRPIRMPLRYTCIVCCGMLTSTTTGPLGESCGFHQDPPGLRGPVGLPIGVPFVWNDGRSIAWGTVKRPMEMAGFARSFVV